MAWLDSSLTIIAQIRIALSWRTRLLIIGLLTLAAVLIAAALPRIPQDPAYHRFADQRTFFGIPSFFDVVSNAAFVVVGVLGLVFLWRHQAASAESAFVKKVEKWPYGIFFLGTVLIGLGSAYYHLSPDNARLFWDRLPMAIVFMALLAALLTERISLRVGLLALWPLVALGAGSVGYWLLSEQYAVGDLRPYGLVQFFPGLLIPLLMLLFPPRYTRGGDIVVVLGFYALALLAQALDEALFALGRIVSGHTLKHLLAALAIYWILRMLRRRRPVV